MKNKTETLPQVGFKLSPELWKRIIRYYENTYGGVIPTDFPMEDFARQRLESASDQLRRLQSLKISKKNSILDAGCGLGQYMLLALQAGYDYYGYEVDKDAYGIAVELLRLNGEDPKRIILFKSDPPYKTKKFDFITSFEVAEHVSDLNTYITSLAGMLEKNGRIFIETPNYLMPYEPHYYVFVPPFLPKSMKWKFFTRKGRTNRMFFNELNFVTPQKFANAFRHAGLKWSNLGIDEWYQQIAVNPAANRSTHVKKISALLKKLKLTKGVYYLARAGVYTPQVYIAQRVEN